MDRTARATLDIIDRGQYDNGRGATIELRAAIEAASANTRLYRPTELESLVAAIEPGSGSRGQVTVANESSQVAGRRLAASSNPPGVALLNFASAKNPGGGFINGAKAQEEDLCRCSALYPCLLTQPAYYEVNRANRSPVYTDHLIYSPAVPFFRESTGVLERPFEVSVITSPAPNAGAALRRSADLRGTVDAALKRRIGHILAVAAEHGHRDLVLGAWGCGAFRNDPHTVATLFAVWLADERFASRFDRAHFPVLDHTRDRANIRAFESILSPT